MIIRHFVFGDVDVASLSVPDRIAVGDVDALAPLKNMEDLLPVVHGRTLGEQLATLAGHDRQHRGWAIQGLADRASRG